MAQDLPTPQSDGSADEEIIERQLEIERLYRELSQESYAGLVAEAEDPLLRRLLAQEESLRQHILQTPQQPRGRRHYDDGSHRDDSSFPYYAPQPQQGPYWDPIDASPSPPHVPIPDPGHLTSPYGQYPPQTSFVSQFIQHDAPDLTKTTIAGYEKLATELAESTDEARDETNRGIKPVYRRFEYLNHRILLHIQDELAEMEEELRLVDEYIAQTTAVGDDEDAQPASRRLERRYGGDLHSRRTLLLGNIYVKLGQYSDAMSSYGKMMKVLEPAKAEDISRYQAWLHLHAPISEAESRFLKRGADLMVLPRRQQQQLRIFGVHGLDTIQAATLALPVFLLLPLIAYSIIPGFGARMFVLAILGISEATMVASTRFYQIMTVREWGVCAAA
ncbi:uncharacterized protein K452DRAFT_217741 [Aplosporella prunicola CBS 121167]|uniref:DUF6594 domain-containing protein n=1 Tax=Aplosporella prunicola CBS 121167 TaxID=1176127 RepID=A0A6A6BVI3_9PEZI|nr:uncharacterized protein K452DRAFT_217741 [Aplosporella prunicola CBS 121167]KAF2147285.1 hypothetical protein K452DRAFT_217741 [Aplosporella prunicola CBS 121167]